MITKKKKPSNKDKLNAERAKHQSEFSTMKGDTDGDGTAPGMSMPQDTVSTEGNQEASAEEDVEMEDVHF